MTGESRGSFRILSLDGGGIRGIFTAAFLSQLEERVDGDIGSYFDLIAGTSTGGIVACALAMGIPAARIEQLYMDTGASIFRRLHPRRSRTNRLLVYAANRLLGRMGLDWDMLMGPRYGDAALKHELAAVFAERDRIGFARTRLVIPAVDLTSGKTVVFKTAHLPEFDTDYKRSVVDVLLATTAAPTYFPPAVLGSNGAYADGGLWANNPCVVAFVEATRIADYCAATGTPSFARSDVHILSIGTGSDNYSLLPTPKACGIAWWADKLVDSVLTSQAQGVGFQAAQLLGSNYHRVDFGLPSSDWKLDAVGFRKQLAHIGRTEAQNRYKSLKGFLSTPAAPFRPFHDL